VAKGGIEPPTQGFSESLWQSTYYIFQYVSSALGLFSRGLLCILHP
jgi:hypothetical protein